jgi:uracil-DNA glycosylase family 4
MPIFDHSYAACDVCPLNYNRTKMPSLEVKAHQPKVLLDQINYPVMLVGEAPGRVECARQEPFVGPSGELLDAMLAKLGVTRDQVWITNALLCRPPQNDMKEAEGAIEACHSRLVAEIEHFKPKVIIALGASAYKALSGIVKQAERRRLLACPTCEGEGYWRRELAPWLSSKQQWDGDPNEPLDCPDCEGQGRRFQMVVVDRLALARGLVQDVGSIQAPEERPFSLLADQTWTLVPVFHPSAMIRDARGKDDGGKSFLGPPVIPATVRHIGRAFRLSQGEQLHEYINEAWLVQGECQEARDFLKQHSEYTIDIEFEPLDTKRWRKSNDPAHHRLTVVGICRDGVSYVFDLTVPGPHHEYVREFLADGNIGKCGHMISADVTGLEYHVGPVNGPLTDTLLLHHAIWPEEPQSLAFTAHTYLGVAPWKPPRRHSVQHFHSLKELALYNARDTIYTDALIPHLVTEAKEEGINPDLIDLDMKLVRVGCDMTKTGVPIDRVRLKIASLLMEQRLAKALKVYQDLAGETDAPAGGWSPTKPNQLRTVLFERWGLPSDQKTKTGLASTRAGVLTALRHLHPGVEALLAYRDVAKTLTTNVRPWLRLWRWHPEYELGDVGTDINVLEPPDAARWGAIHPAWKTCMQVSGRWSNNPNFMAVSSEPLFWTCKNCTPNPDWLLILKQLEAGEKAGILPHDVKECPTCSGKGKDLRKFSLRSIVAAPPGYKLVGADAAAIEFRILAALTGGALFDFVNRPEDEARKYDPTYDPHSFVANTAFPDLFPNGGPETKKRLRDLAKRGDYGMAYGAVETTIWKNLRVEVPTLTLRTVEAVFKAFHTLSPEYKHRITERIAEAYEKRYLESKVLGRRRPYCWGEIPPTDIANFAIQSSAADMMNLAMLEVWTEIIRLILRMGENGAPLDVNLARIIMQVHDQIVALAKTEVADEVGQIIENAMRQKHDFGYGEMLYDAHYKVADTWGDL